jgi:hypothetical protein
MQYRGSASSDKMEVEPLRLHSQSGDWEREKIKPYNNNNSSFLVSDKECSIEALPLLIK